MKATLLAEVQQLELKDEYPQKPDGSSDYSKAKIDYWTTTLRILDNQLKVRGQVTLRETLLPGQLFKITIDTTSPVEVIDYEADKQNPGLFSEPS